MPVISHLPENPRQESAAFLRALLGSNNCEFPGLMEAPLPSDALALAIFRDGGIPYHDGWFDLGGKTMSEIFEALIVADGGLPFCGASKFPRRQEIDRRYPTVPRGPRQRVEVILTTSRQIPQRGLPKSTIRVEFPDGKPTWVLVQG